MLAIKPAIPKENKMTYYINYSKFQMNKEVTRICRLINENEYKNFLSTKEYNLLVIRIKELELRLNTTININN